MIDKTHTHTEGLQKEKNIEFFALFALSRFIVYKDTCSKWAKSHKHVPVPPHLHPLLPYLVYL